VVVLATHHSTFIGGILMENIATIPLDEAIIIKEYIKLGSVTDFKRLKEGCTVIIKHEYGYSQFYTYYEIVTKDQAIQELSTEISRLEAEIQLKNDKIDNLTKSVGKFRSMSFVKRLKYVFTGEVE
jgi:hypothetical protein